MPTIIYSLYMVMVFTPSALTVSVVQVLHSGLLKGPTRQYHTSVVNVWLQQGESYTCCNQLMFDIEFTASQTVNSSGCGYLI